MDFKKLLRWCRIVGPGKDDKQFPVQQVSYLGKTSNAYVIFPYGMHGNVNKDALGVLNLIGGINSAKAVMPLDPDNRPKGLAAGEVAFYHPDTGSVIHFRSDGNLDITTVKNVNVNTTDTTVSCESMDVAASNQVNLNTPEVTISGNATVQGNLTVVGNTTLGVIVTSGGKNIGATHTHGGSPTAPTGAVSPTGVPN